MCIAGFESAAPMSAVEALLGLFLLLSPPPPVDLLVEEEARATTLQADVC
jgi:hypothetical protein